VGNPFFPNDAYHTSDGTRRVIGDRLLLGSRWWFYLRFAAIVLRSRSYALRGIYSDELWAKTSHAVFRRIEESGGRFHLTGLNHLAEGRDPMVIVSNHMSTLETIIFPCIIVPFRPLTFVVKDSLVRGLFGPIMRSRSPVVVGRKNPRQDLQTVFEEGQDRLERGFSIVIFPQSTRRTDFSPDHFNSLGVKLARRAGVRVLPVAIKTDFWGNGKRLKEFGPLNRNHPIHMAFGVPRPITGNGNDTQLDIIRFIQDHLDDWKSQDAAR